VDGDYLDDLDDDGFLAHHKMYGEPGDEYQLFG
jgi:hypothetical protein